MNQEPGLSGEQWKELVAKIARHLKHPASLCLIGSGPGLLAGQPNRVSIDLDTLNRASKFDHHDLKQACEKAGVRFDPKDELESDTPYLQIVEEGIVQLGKFVKTTKILETGELTLVRPPLANIIASKLVRAAPKDIEDIAFLLQTFRVERNSVAAVIKSFAALSRERAAENLIYVDALCHRFQFEEGRARKKKAARKKKKP